jgi:serine phosphatase RsbU (regulator of sigma subunit)
MTKVTYKVVPHDGGWAYRQGDVYSETFPSHSDALQAARIVAAEQQVGGDPEEISWQDEKGIWHTEYSEGGDRPEAEVMDGDEASTTH